MSDPAASLPDPIDREPVTVAVTRRAHTSHTALVMAWVNAGTSLAERYPGFLGSGWVKPAVDSDEWTMLYRFDSPESLAVWEASEERRRWLASGQDMIEDTRKERRTGIEGWFGTAPDGPAETPAPSPPPRWKQAVMIWFAFFPLSLAVTLIAGLVAPGLSVVPRVLFSTLAMTPVMTYVVLPFLTSKLEWWLQGRPAPWRSR